MQNVTFVAYRYLTNADFFNIYKPEGTEGAGGGQTYIDFPAGDITLKDWQEFFDGAEGVEIKQRTYGPAWTFRLNSLGLTGAEDLTIYQRRKQSFTIASQRLGSRHSNRPRAWHPDYGFPEPVDPEDRQALPSALAIYLVRSDQGEFWAGWFQDREPSRDDPSKETLSNMLVSDPSEGQTGFIRIADAKLLIDQWDSVTPFLSDDAVQAKNWEAEIAILKIE
ncbi:MAG: HNH endonuclease, partial [Chloroflexi bacterium]|nr:HNH endonuclease [Chloroflexota bacterium]